MNRMISELGNFKFRWVAGICHGLSCCYFTQLAWLNIDGRYVTQLICYLNIVSLAKY